MTPRTIADLRAAVGRVNVARGERADALRVTCCPFPTLEHLSRVDVAAADSAPHWLAMEIAGDTPERAIASAWGEVERRVALRERGPATLYDRAVVALTERLGLPTVQRPTTRGGVPLGGHQTVWRGGQMVLLQAHGDRVYLTIGTVHVAGIARWALHDPRDLAHAVDGVDVVAPGPRATAVADGLRSIAARAVEAEGGHAV